ncbi:ATP-dependent RNA helicase ddx1, partial [Chrysochromulina tobinii]
MAAFAELGLDAPIVRAVEDLGWLLPTPVQQEAIPLILGGGDVMAAAETGSGKTGAFALPVLQICHEALREQAAASSQPKIAALAAAAARAQAAGGIGFGSDRDGLLQVEQLGDGLCRVGWATLSAKLALGTDKMGFGFGGTGKKSNGNQFVDYGDSYARGDVIGCELDREIGSMAFYKNGVSLGEAFSVPPTLKGTALFPAICLKGAAPARELCEQVHECVAQFSRYFAEPRLEAALLTGGVDPGPQLKRLRAGVDIVCGTPGRVWDLVSSGKLVLSGVQFLVLDEADRLLDTGHLDTILKLHAKLPPVGGQGILGWVPPRARATLRGVHTPRAIKVPLQSGDALVLKQVEIHRTDSHALQPDQWRLAIGFKVLQQRPVHRAAVEDSPFGHDTTRVRRRYPGLVPDFSLGRPFPTVYNRSAIEALARRTERFESLPGIAADTFIYMFSSVHTVLVAVSVVGAMIVAAVAYHEASRGALGTAR